MTEPVIALPFPGVSYREQPLLHEALELTAGLRPENLALLSGNQQLSYRELDGLVNACARALLERGVRPGDRVALMSGNRPEFMIVTFAVLKLGGALVAISPAWKEAEVAHALELTEPSHVVHDAGARPTLAHLVDDIRGIDLDDERFLPSVVEQSGERIGAVVDVDADAVFVFSSGTTGLPKAVRHTHRSLGAAVVHWRSALGLTAADRFQISTPPSHILGLLNFVTSAAAGSAVRLHARFDVEQFLTSAVEDRTTLEMAVAPIALALAQYDDLERFDLSALRYMIWGATPIAEDVARVVTERSGVRWMPGYGASEVPVIALNPVRRPDLWRLDSAGLPVHDVAVRVVDLDSGEVLPRGGSGELQVQSPSAMAGYLPSSANDDAIVDGWYRTGDIGWIEPEGWIHITDRCKEMIKVRGFQVAPAEIEAILLSVPGVTDCAVFGVPDESLGEAVIAAVSVDRRVEVNSDGLQAEVKDKLAHYKQVRHVAFVDQIPRLPSGKVLRRELKERWLRHPGRL